MNDTIFDEERELQETNSELDEFLAKVQEELSELKNDLDRYKARGKTPPLKLRRKLPAFELAILGKEIEEIKAFMLDEDETVSLVETHGVPGHSDKPTSLEKLVRDVEKYVSDERKGGRDALSVVTDVATAEKVLDFYIIYAIFVEYFHSMKMLYQVLLAEYEAIGALGARVIGELRTEAIGKITLQLCRQGWRGVNGAANRRAFRQSMVRSIRKRIGNREASEPMSALCLSGGGIRSATFGLGVIQGLARHGLLTKFDYLSTVSGGGYIGSWLSAWASREAGRGVKAVEDELVRCDGGEIEPAEVTYLRSFSNYMSPRTGLLSADTWTLVVVYLRNLILNWLVVVPFLAAFLLVPRLLVEFTYNGQALVGTEAGFQAAIVTVGSSLIGGFAFFWITVFRPSHSKFLPEDSRLQQRFRRDHLGRIKNMDVSVLLYCVLPLFLFAMGITTYGYWLVQSPERTAWIAAAQDVVRSNQGYWMFGILALVFASLAFANLRRDTRLEGAWDKFFGSVVIGICIIVGCLQLVLTESLMLFDLVAFTNLIFIGGFVAARLFIYSRKQTRKGDGFGDTVPIEFSMSFLSASIGGSILYVAYQWMIWVKPAPEIYTTVAVPMFISIFLLAATFFVGIGSKILDDLDREWASRLGAWILIAIVGWLLVCGLALLGAKLFEWARGAASEWLISAGGIAGVISGIVTLLFGYYAKNAAKDEGHKPKGAARALAQVAPQIAAPVFAAFVLILIVVGTNALMTLVGSEVEFLRYQKPLESWPGHIPPEGWPTSHGMIVILIWIAIFLAVGSLMGWWINVNKFSLHATYRERLIRAYLGASRGAERFTTANSFVGLDPNDNVEMWRLPTRPFHIVNMTLNIAKSASLRWQTRKSESFTVSKLHAGSSNMGGGSGTFRNSRLFGADKLGRGISLGTAAAISGAAASPNMGYYTQSAPVSALMALFNIRLGWWLGNPGRRGDRTFYKNAPEFSPKLFLYEALGQTADTNAYIYLSDGGHFENLGLYEMVVRRCRFILLSDAGADEGFGFSDLGSAVHKIRVDMGIPVEFVDGELPIEGRSCSIATIRYSCVDGTSAKNDGILIYIKPTLDGCEPIDLVNYKKKFPQFPHESTADQWFSEMQFESYRSLGSHMVDAVWGEHTDACKKTGCPTFASLRSHAEACIDTWRGRRAVDK